MRIPSGVLSLASARGVELADDEPLPGLLRLVDSLADDGYVVVLKWDGERGVGDPPRHTMLISRGALKGDPIRSDNATMEGALSDALARLPAE